MILFSDIIKEVIDQQSTLYDNVNIVANFFKYEQVRFKWNFDTVFSFTCPAATLRQNYWDLTWWWRQRRGRNMYRVFAETSL